MVLALLKNARKPIIGNNDEGGEKTTMTIAERNAIRYPGELGNPNENRDALDGWAKSATIVPSAEYVDRKPPCERGVWDLSDEKGQLFPSNSSYTCLLERQ